jgi:hypothetical protein
VGLLKAQGARLERRGSNFQKPPREELKLGGVRKAENASGKTQPVVQWALGASQSPPKTCGCAALEGQFSARRAGVKTAVLLLHRLLAALVVESSATPHAPAP